MADSQPTITVWVMPTQPGDDEYAKFERVRDVMKFPGGVVTLTTEDGTFTRSGEIIRMLPTND